MSRISGKSCLHLVDGIDFSGVSNSAVLDFSESPADVTAFLDTDMTYVEGKATFRFNIQGLFSSASPDYDGTMFTNLTTTQRRVGVYPGGSAEGTVGYEGRTNITATPRVSTTGAAVGLNVDWIGDQAPSRGQLLYKQAAVAATENGTKYQVGAAAAGQTTVGILRLLSAPGGSGNNNCVVTIESDANSSAGGETTRLTFTTLTQASAIQFELKELAGAVTDTWWRVVVTITGAGSRTFDLLLTLGMRAT